MGACLGLFLSKMELISVVPMSQGPAELGARPEDQGASANVTTVKPAEPGLSGEGQRDSELPTRWGRGSRADAGFRGFSHFLFSEPRSGGLRADTRSETVGPRLKP